MTNKWHLKDIHAYEIDSLLSKPQRGKTIVVFLNSWLQNMKARLTEKEYAICIKVSRKFQRCFLNWNVKKILYFYFAS